MTQEIEIEYKNILTKEEYDKLLQVFPFPREGLKQVNHYFETPDFKLKQHKSAIRIREINGTFRLTLKQPYEQGLLETHDDLTEHEAQLWRQGNIIPQKNTLKQLHAMGISANELVYFGSLTTIRREFTDHSIQYVLDCSMYHGQIDYELEIEAPTVSAGKKAFDTLLKTYAITRKTTPNKIERFFSAMENR